MSLESNYNQQKSLKNKNVPDYIKTSWRSKPMLEIKMSNSDCAKCQDRLHNQTGGYEMHCENKCPFHTKSFHLYYSNFYIHELKLKNFFKYVEIDVLDIGKPPAVPVSIWSEWAEFWDDHKVTYVSLSWIHRFPEYCRSTSVEWKEKIFSYYPYLEMEISYYDNISLDLEEDFLKISLDEVESHTLTLEIWKELCHKRFWVQFRLYLRDAEFEVKDEHLQFFFAIRGIIKEPPFKSIGRHHIPKYVKKFMPRCPSQSSFVSFHDDGEALAQWASFETVSTAGYQLASKDNSGLESSKQKELHFLPVIHEGVEEIVDQDEEIVDQENTAQNFESNPSGAEDLPTGALDEEWGFEISEEELLEAQNTDFYQIFLKNSGNTRESSKQCDHIPEDSNHNNQLDFATEDRVPITTVSVSGWFNIKNIIPSLYSSFRNIVFAFFKPRSIFGYRFYKSITPIWSLIHRLQRKIKAKNVMLRAERQSLLMLRDMFNPDFNQVFFYPPVLGEESEHITEVKEIRVNGMAVLPRLIKISSIDDDEKADKEIFAKILSEEELEKEAERLGVFEEHYGDSGSASSLIELTEPEKIHDRDNLLNQFVSREKKKWMKQNRYHVLKYKSLKNATMMIEKISNLCEIMKYPESHEGDVPLPSDYFVELSESWIKRHRIFHKYDEGVYIDYGSWHTTIPEALAMHQAERLRNKTVIDAFCGVGCNAIQLAAYCDHVIAIDENHEKIEISRNIARIYKVENKIQFVEGDFFRLARNLKADAVFLKPPCYEISKDGHMDVLTLGGRMNCEHLLHVASSISRNIALYLPSYSNLPQIVGLAKKFGAIEIEVSSIDEKMYGITVYFGELINKAREFST